MTGFEIQVYTDADEFTEKWRTFGYDPVEAEQYWALLGELASGELLVRIPEWLADEKIRFVDGAVPTAFVGRITKESEKAIHLTESAAARPLSQLAHRMQSLEASITRLQNEPNPDADRIEWLQRRLDEKQDEFAAREDIASLADEWLPKSQIEFAGRGPPNR